MKPYILLFQTHRDNKGSLIAIEESKDVPFQIKRVYYMYDNNTSRGHHAHKSLEQVIICVHGGCKIKLDDGIEEKCLNLKQPDEGIYIPSAIWREIYDFLPETVLLVLASEPYDECEYIRDYTEFLKYVKDNKNG